MLKAPWAGWNHNCLMPAGSSWTCWKEEVWNISMVHEAGNWKRIPTSCFQMKQETGSGFQLPASKMIGMEARPWASTNLNPERRGGLSLLKRSSCQDPRQNRVKKATWFMWIKPGKCFVSSPAGPNGSVPKCPAAAARRQAVPVPSPGPLVCN